MQECDVRGAWAYGSITGEEFKILRMLTIITFEKLVLFKGRFEGQGDWRSLTQVFDLYPDVVAYLGVFYSSAQLVSHWVPAHVVLKWAFCVCSSKQFSVASCVEGCVRPDTSENALLLLLALTTAEKLGQLTSAEASFLEAWKGYVEVNFACTGVPYHQFIRMGKGPWKGSWYIKQYHTALMSDGEPHEVMNRCGRLVALQAFKAIFNDISENRNDWFKARRLKKNVPLTSAAHIYVSVPDGMRTWADSICAVEVYGCGRAFRYKEKVMDPAPNLTSHFLKFHTLMDTVRILNSPLYELEEDEDSMVRWMPAEIVQEIELLHVRQLSYQYGHQSSYLDPDNHELDISKWFRRHDRHHAAREMMDSLDGISALLGQWIIYS